MLGLKIYMMFLEGRRVHKTPASKSRGISARRASAHYLILTEKSLIITSTTQSTRTLDLRFSHFKAPLMAKMYLVTLSIKIQI